MSTLIDAWRIVAVAAVAVAIFAAGYLVGMRDNKLIDAIRERQDA